MSDDTDPVGSDNVIVADFGRARAPSARAEPPSPSPSDSVRMPITRVPGSDAELERALAGRDHDAWLDLVDVLDVRLARALERSDLVDNVLPLVEAELARWPAEVSRPASPRWLKAHDARDPLAPRLLALTRAPGGYVLSRHFCEAGHDEPSNGALLHARTDDLLGDCAAFFAAVCGHVDPATALLGVEYELCVLRWGVAVAPRIDLCERLSVELDGERLTLAAARLQRARTRERVASSAAPVILQLAALPPLPTPEATARLAELAPTDHCEGKPVYRVLGLLEELHGSW